MQNSKALLAVDWDSQEMQNQIKAQIKQNFGSELTPVEWNLFVAVGKMTGLNPILKEIWAVKYGKSNAQIFIGRDGYRKSAQAHPEYDYHVKGSVFENDEYRYEDGKVYHKPNFINPGKLIGSYCLVKRKSSSLPNYTFVRFKEYYQGNKNPDGTIKKKKFQDYNTKQWKEKEMGPTLWDTKETTMNEKVAEAQGLRMTYQELFAGTYDESEEPQENANIVVLNQEKISELKNKIAQAKKPADVILIPKEILAAYNKKEIDKESATELKKLCSDKMAEFEKDSKVNVQVKAAEETFGAKAEDISDGEILPPKKEEEKHWKKPRKVEKHGIEDPCKDETCIIHVAK